jgi:hypothetical protein
LNQSLAGQANQNTTYATGLDQGTAQYNQGLQQTVASLRPQLANQYLQAASSPIQTGQQIISGNTSNLSGLTNLDQTANAYNLVTPYQGNAAPASSPGMSAPRSSTPSVATYPSVPNYGASAYSNPQVANQTSTANNYGAYANNANTQTGQNVGGNQAVYGPNGNMTYDAQTGVYTDPSGNQYIHENNQFVQVAYGSS